MTFKKLFLAASIFAAGVFAAAASDIIDNAPGTRNGTPGAFSYIGSGGSNDHLGGYKYDIYSMNVSRSDAGVLTVRINTKFVDYNNQGYKFGDLFMSTTGWNPTGNASDGYQADNAFTTGTQWNYVYDLNSARGQTGNRTNTRSARLRELNDYDLSNASDQDDFVYGSDRGVHGSPASGDEHLYRVKNSAVAAEIGGGSVRTSTTHDYLEFVFDVSGTALASTEQIAFHWALSCANDIIEGVVNFAGDVPEPAALGLLLIGLTALGFARRRRQSV